MDSFIFNIPTKVIFGTGKIKQLNCFIPSDINKIFLVTDNHLINNNPLINKIIQELDKKSKLTVFSEVEENPSIETITKGAKICKTKSCRLVIGLGGGSSMDTAKGISLITPNTGLLQEYLNGLKIKNTPLPIVCIPTTSGTGSEITPFAVFSDSKNHTKCGFSHPGIFPFLSIIDPELTYSMPENVTINTGLDVLAHAIEAYLSDLSFDLNDLYALKAMQIVFENLPQASGKDKNAMQIMAYASMLAGAAITHASTILPHIMGYPLTVFNSIPHGLASFLTIPAFLQYLMENNLQIKKVKNILNLVGGFNHLENWIQKLGISKSLHSYGVLESQLKLFAEKTIVKSDIQITPGNISMDNIIQIYKNSL